MSQKYAFLEKIGREPSNLIKGLQAVQGVEGYVSDESIRVISEYFGIPEVEVEGVLSFYAQFKRVKPGITGLWQVSGRSEVDYPNRVALDMNYIMNWSIWMDYFIFLKTIKEVLFCRGAY